MLSNEEKISGKENGVKWNDMKILIVDGVKGGFDTSWCLEDLFT